jgi:flavin-dependent dehydrogenase
MTYDAIIAGGGPGGSSTASYLRLRGRKVLVLEREKFPRFHLGESLLPFGNDLYKELGVFEEIDRRYIHKPGARFLHEETGSRFTYYFDTAIEPGRPYAYQVPRADFDQLLLDNARRLGADVREETEVRKLRVLPTHVEVDAVGPAGPFTAEAPLFVDATGRDTFLARHMGDAVGSKVADDLITTNVACFTHYEDAVREPGDDEGNFTLIMFNGGWWWFIPFRGNVTSIGVVFEKDYTLARRGLSPEQLFDGAIAEQREIKKILVGAKRVRPILSTGNWSYRCDRYYGERTLLVGDAAAFIDPLFSTGVLMAMMGGKLAAETIDAAFAAGDFSAARFAPYQQKAVAGADKFKRLVHEFYGERLRKLLLASAANPTMCAVITSMLAGDVYKPRLWHDAVKSGFSRGVSDAELDGDAPRARSSRQVKAAVRT